MKNKISIILRANNEEKSLRKVMPLIYSQKKVLKPEVVLIDSRENLDKVKDLIKKYSIKAFYISQKNFSHSWTMNFGVTNSSGDISVFISPHCIPENDLWLYQLTKHFTDKKVGAVFGAQIPIKELNLIDEFKLTKIFPSDGSKSLAKFSNANGAIRKNLLLKYPYDENVEFQYFGGEDQKMVPKIKKEGYKVIYEPLSRVYHLHEYSLKGRLKALYDEGYHSKEFERWNVGISMLRYSKKELIDFLWRNKKYKMIIFNLFIHGFLIRFAKIFGKLKRQIDEKILGKKFVPFYKIQKKEYFRYK